MNIEKEIGEIVDKHLESKTKLKISETLSYLSGKIAVLSAKNIILEKALKEKGINIDDKQKEYEEVLKREADKVLTELEMI